MDENPSDKPYHIYLQSVSLIGVQLNTIHLKRATRLPKDGDRR